MPMKRGTKMQLTLGDALGILGVPAIRDQKQTAEILGVSTSAVSMAEQSIMRKLRKALEPFAREAGIKKAGL